MTTDADAAEEYDVAVVGGGPAGLTAALYATRLGLDTAVVDRGGGRAAMMLDTHNVIGVTEDVSGMEFLRTAIEQVRAYGADYHQGTVTGIDRIDGDREGVDGDGTGIDGDGTGIDGDGTGIDGDGNEVDGNGNEVDGDGTVTDGDASGGNDREPRFRVEATDRALVARRVVLSTGFTDGRPDPPLPRTGRGLHYCLHCDAYTFVDESVYVMGRSDSAANVAMIMLNYTEEVDLLLNGDDPAWSEETAELLAAHPVDVVEAEVTGTYRHPEHDDWLGGFEFADGTTRDYRGGFAMYGADYNNDLAADLGCAINEDGTVAVDEDGRTSVEGVYAVGDLTPGHNQIPVAMGEGAKAGIAIHKELRAFPRSLEAVRESGPVAPEETPAVSERLRERAAAFRNEGDLEVSADD